MLPAANRQLSYLVLASIYFLRIPAFTISIGFAAAVTSVNVVAAVCSAINRFIHASVTWYFVYLEPVKVIYPCLRSFLIS